MQVNRCYRDLEQSYLFSTIAKKVREHKENNPQAKVISLGIGDVTQPLCPAVVEAMQQAVAEMGTASAFRGYGPEQGYDFLRNELVAYYAQRGVELQADEIFISDGAKSDLGNILDLFGVDNTVLVPDPVYPVYVDTNIMAGRRIVYMNATQENNFLPMPDPSVHADIVYLCSPNNPTGAVYSANQLKEFVAYAKQHNAVLLFDAAYEAFVQDPTLPHSIYEIEGAKECAIEFCSFSKTAGFTGTRCGYTVVPKALIADDMSLNQMWLRRQTTKFNGVPYIVQRGAAAVFSEQGQQQIKEGIAYYLENAAIIAQALSEMGVWYTGGTNSPYIWMQCPAGMSSWEFFEYLLKNADVVGTPGAGFGKNGEGFFRLTAFGSRENTIEAVRRIRALKF